MLKSESDLLNAPLGPNPGACRVPEVLSLLASWLRMPDDSLSKAGHHSWKSTKFTYEFTNLKSSAFGDT